MNYAIDLDGTLAAWCDDRRRCGEWIDGAQQMILDLVSANHRVLVHSVRCTWEYGGGLAEVVRFVESGPFVAEVIPDNAHEWSAIRPVLSTSAAPTAEIVVGVWNGVGKPIAHWYVDDRGVHFREEIGWPTMTEYLLALGRLG